MIVQKNDVLIDSKLEFTDMYCQTGSFEIQVQAGALFGAYFENTDCNFLNNK